MNKKGTLIATKPIGLLNKTIGFDFKSLFISLSSGTIALLTLNKPEVLKSAISIINSIKFKSKPEVLIYSLIVNSIQNSILDIVDENSGKFCSEFTTIEKFNEYKEYQDLIEEIQESIDSQQLEIGIDFFDNPTNINIFKPLGNIIKKWFKLFGLSNLEAEFSAQKLKSYYIFSLNDNWRNNSEDYQIIFEKLITPFSNITKIELEWRAYHSYLIKQIDQPVFDEHFGIQDIFISTPGYIERKKKKEETLYIERHVIQVFDTLKKWLNQTKEEEDCIKVISGGPGSGKSTLAKMFSALIAKENALKVLYIPLQHLNIKEDLTISLGDYLHESNFFLHNPLEEIHKNSTQLLIIFDGLDELSKQGKHAFELAKEFIHEIQRKIANINRVKLKLFVLLTGRELSIQNQSSLFRRPNQIIHLLPYYVADKDLYVDKGKLLKPDLRNDWWSKYGELKGLKYSGFPKELINPNLDDITAQPLLNYLVALTYERNIVKFSENTNLNEIYGDLIKAVFDRQYEKKQHKVITELSINENSFFRILEEIAISAWHSGDIRTTTILEINKHIKHNNLDVLFKEFQLGVQAGISRLLTAFYFRQKGVDNDQNKTFEFTHKSFGEYLAARRIVNFMLLQNKKIVAYDLDPDDGVDRKEALKKIIETLGVMPIDNYLFSFLQNEIKLLPKKETEQLQQTLISLVEFVIHKGMPVELLSPRPNFEKEQCYYRNTLLFLFLMLKISSDCTKIRSTINWSTDSTLAEFFGIMRPMKPPKVDRKEQASNKSQRHENLRSLFNICFTYMEINNCHLSSTDLTYSDFSNSKLSNVVLAGCDLFGSNFGNTEIIDSNFYRANLQRCRFENTKIINNKYLKTGQVAEMESFDNIEGLDEDFVKAALIEFKKEKEKYESPPKKQKRKKTTANKR